MLLYKNYVYTIFLQLQGKKNLLFFLALVGKPENSKGTKIDYCGIDISYIFLRETLHLNKATQTLFIKSGGGLHLLKSDSVAFTFTGMQGKTGE